MYEIAAAHEAVHSRLSIAAMKVAERRHPTVEEWENFQEGITSLVQAFGQDLAAEYAADLPADVQQTLFDKAWAESFDAGFRAIERQYAELVILTRFIRNH